MYATRQLAGTALALRRWLAFMVMIGSVAVPFGVSGSGFSRCRAGRGQDRQRSTASPAGAKARLTAKLRTGGILGVHGVGASNSDERKRF